LAILSAAPATATSVEIGARVFGSADQEMFARLSGDVNPVHMPGQSAQRALADRAVVHGTHTLLWSLECLHAAWPDLRPLTSVKARFARMVLQDDRATVSSTWTAQDKLRLDVSTNGERAATFQIGYGHARGSRRDVVDAPLLQLSSPRDLAWSEVADCRGRMVAAAPSGEIASAFPAASAAMGAARIAGLCCASAIVGMACPGLHSILGGLALETADAAPDEAMSFAVASVNDPFHLATLSVNGSGWAGTIDALIRMGAEATT
jgi:acyl dehydratase